MERPTTPLQAVLRRLLDRCRDQGMTQAAVAKKIPCSLPHLNATINNDRRLSGQKLFRLCEIANATKAEREDVAFALMLDILGGKYEKLNLSPIAKFMTDHMSEKDRRSVVLDLAREMAGLDGWGWPP